ncbi:FHA domain-containing protein [Candidatus Sumerlaeota bacterium]|nr:FHA domain-containing protein [Candidatus Sumerlaeota bacterium]
MASEAYLESVEKGDRFDLKKDEVSIGRSPSNDLHFGFAEISSRHAVIRRQGDEWTLEDTGSTNGTFVGGEKISGSVQLKAGDVIRFGRPEYVFKVVQAKEVYDEPTMLFGGGQQPGGEATIAFGSGAGPAPDKTTADFSAVGGEDAFGGFSDDAFKNMMGGGAQQEAPAAPAKGSKAVGSGEKTVMGNIQSMPTMLGPSPTILGVIHGKIFAELEEKTLQARKQVLPLTSIESVIGSNPDQCAVVVKNDTVAEQHAQITFMQGGRIQVKLLNNNATLKVNGKAYKTQYIKDGDSLEFGEMAYYFRLREMPVFSEKKPLIGRKVMIVGGVLLFVFIVLVGLLVSGGDDKKAPGGGGQASGSGTGAATTTGGGAATGTVEEIPTEMAQTITPDEIWTLVEREMFKQAEEQIEVYRKNSVVAKQKGESYTIPEEVQNALETITKLDQGQRAFQKTDYYNAWLALQDLPAGRSQQLDIVQRDKRKYKEALEDNAGKQYNEGVRSFKREDYASAKTYFEKAEEIYPGYKDTKLYISKVAIHLHYMPQIEAVEDLLKKRQIEKAYEEIDKITEYNTAGLTDEALEEVKRFESMKESLLKHASMYRMYQAGQADRLFDIFKTIPEDYSRYRELEALVNQAKDVSEAYEKAMQSTKSEDFEAVLMLEPNTSIWYNIEARKQKDSIINELRKKANELLAEGRKLRAEGKEFEALKKYFEAWKVEPNFKDSRSSCEQLASQLIFQIYQMSDDERLQKIHLYESIIENTPEDSKPHRDAQAQIKQL